MPGPLTNLRVVELGGIGPVPHAGMILSDLGAEVVQIVRPGLVADHVTRSDVTNRGKLSVAVDLKTDPDLVLRLCARSDVLIEGFRPGVAERLGLGPDQVREVNDRLVYGRMTGWGQEGPMAHMAGHDIDYIAVSGVLGAIGPPDRPLPPLNLVGDFGGGSMLLVVGVLAALHQRHTTGAGETVDAAMVDGSALLMAMHHGARAGGWWNGERGTDLFDGAAPFYTTYATADGGWMAVGALEPQFYTELVEGLGLDPAEMGAQMDRTRWSDTHDRFAGVFATRTRQQWEEVFGGGDACVVGVHTMDEAPTHPHLRERATFVDSDGVMQPAPAPRFSSGGLVAGPIPEPGEHTGLVLERLGLEPDKAP